jgi:hypothetical protein
MEKAADISDQVGDIVYLRIDGLQGSGREPCSRQVFRHVEGPDGVVFSYMTA